MDQHAVIVADTTGVISHWNQGAETLFGYRADEAVKDPKIKDLAADLPVRCADGEVRSFAGRLLVLSDGLGVAIGAMAIYSATGTTGVRPFG